MAVTIDSVMRTCNNFFERGSKRGTFTIKGGRLTDEALLSAAPYIAIHGSAFHDGVTSTTVEALDDMDETFSGTVWLLYPPKSFIEIAERISKYNDESPVDGKVSENFGSYSFTRGTGALGPITWQEAFLHELRPYYHSFTEVVC